MGSYYAIVIDSPGSADGERLQKEIEEKFAEINRQMSTWDESSQISKFNQSKSTEWFEVGADFAVVARYGFASGGSVGVREEQTTKAADGKRD
jgi:thiamine biosynthesis lipoprotein